MTTRRLDFRKAVEALKIQQPSFLSLAKRGWICPQCGNGSGNNGTGIAPNPKSGGYKCFKCGFSGDTFDLWKFVNKDLSTAEEQLEAALDYFGIPQEGLFLSQGIINPASPEPAQNQPEKPKKDYSKFFKFTASEISKTDYPAARGFRTPDLVKEFGLGFKEDFGGHAGVIWPGALIIPTSLHSFIARNVDPAAPKEQRYKKIGGSLLFFRGSASGASLETLAKGLNHSQPVFLVEGELDALSVYECGGVAVALGSIANKDLFLKESAPLKAAGATLLLSLDNDQGGRETAVYLAGKLKEMGFPFHIVNPWGEEKDANALLVKDRRLLLENIQNWDKLPKLSPKDLSPATADEKAAYRLGSNLNYLDRFFAGNGAGDPIPTGFAAFDELLEGGLYPGLYTLGAPPASGKSAFCLQLADQLAQAGNEVLYFSLEMTREELIARSLSRLTYLRAISKNLLGVAKTERELSNPHFKASFTAEDYANLSQCQTDYASFAGNLYVVEGIGDFGTAKIRDTVERHIRCTGKKPVVFLDYFQILQPVDLKASDKVNADKNIVELKRISRDFQLVLFNISSFSRANYEKGADTNMSAFKESGGIEYTNDMALALYRPNHDSGLDSERDIVLSVLKNRHGENGVKIAFRYVRAYHYLEETGRLSSSNF